MYATCSSASHNVIVITSSVNQGHLSPQLHGANSTSSKAYPSIPFSSPPSLHCPFPLPHPFPLSRSTDPFLFPFQQIQLEGFMSSPAGFGTEPQLKIEFGAFLSEKSGIWCMTIILVTFMKNYIDFPVSLTKHFSPNIFSGAFAPKFLQGGSKNGAILSHCKYYF